MQLNAVNRLGTGLAHACVWVYGPSMRALAGYVRTFVCTMYIIHAYDMLTWPASRLDHVY